MNGIAQLELRYHMLLLQRWLVSHVVFFSGSGAEVSVGKCDTGKGESHTGESKGYAGDHEDWGHEVEGEQVASVK